MRDRKVIMNIDGKFGQPEAITTALPQGSPTSPIFFCMYISDVQTAVKQTVQESQSISFGDGVTWFVDGNSIEEVTKGLGKCAAESLGWAESNATQFETSKTDAILLSRRHGQR